MSESPKRYKTFGRNRSLRMPGFDYASEHAYFATLRTRSGIPLLAEGRLADVVRDCLFECRERLSYLLFAYCLMPDHAHLLVMPGDGAQQLPRFIQAFKSLSTRSYLQNGGNGLLWQKHYYDHIVRNGESLAAIGEYIILNPVRRGLATSPEQYQYCGLPDDIPF